MNVGYHIATAATSALTRPTPRAHWGARVVAPVAVGNGMAIGSLLQRGVFGKRSCIGRGPGSAEGVDV